MRYAAGIIFTFFIIGGLYYGITLPPADVSGPTADTPITIGFIGPLSGDATSYGASLKNAVFLAVKDLKTQGKNFNVIYEDGKCGGEEAARVFNKLIAVDAVKFVIGGVCNKETIAMAPIAERERAVIFSPSATSTDITDAGDFVFRNIPSDAASGAALADFMRGDYSSIAVVFQETEGVDPFLETFIRRFEEEGGEIVASESFVSGQKDFKPLVLRIKESGAEALVLSFQAAEAAGAFMRQMKKSEALIPLYGNAIMKNNAFIEAAGSAADEAMFIDIAPLDRGNPHVDVFFNDYGKFFGEPQNEFAMAAAYDAVNIIAQGITQLGYAPEKVRDYLYNIPEYEGLIGRYSFDLHGDVVGIPFALWRINKNQIELYTDSL